MESSKEGLTKDEAVKSLGKMAKRFIVKTWTREEPKKDGDDDDEDDDDEKEDGGGKKS